jgi:hypothetical protein
MKCRKRKITEATSKLYFRRKAGFAESCKKISIFVSRFTVPRLPLSTVRRGEESGAMSGAAAPPRRKLTWTGIGTSEKYPFSSAEF